MDEANWELVKRVFHEALGVSLSRRERFVRQVCGDRVDAAGEVIALLRAHEEAKTPDPAEVAPGFGPSVLHDLETSAAKLPVAPTTQHTSRYEIHGEIARGGVGIVLRGQDVDLGREVAMKVIRPEHAEDPTVLRRFIEEAQVGGQLQHPGIVPVYEFGRDEDRRSFFTMKLVRGNTLATMLEARADPAEDRRRFVALFEQVCQTVAYAHARGVVHRDLKPANVMLGSFGEVQVVDWGLAKVLGRDGEPPPEEEAGPVPEPVHTVRSDSHGDESRVGSVMGTPPYMPPEQALGRTDRVDERSDVFALGSILTEILTGAPAYTEPGTAGVLQAARHDIEDAWHRLDACGADGSLVELCRSCLAKDPDDRPRDAAAIAAAVSDHLTAAEERARAGEIEAAKAKVKAREERRARRLTIGLAAAVLLALLLGGGGYLLLESARRESAGQVAEIVNEELKHAHALRGAARRARFDDDRWRRAVEATTRATERAGAEGAEEPVRLRARALAAAVREEAAVAARNRENLERLADIRLSRDDRLDLKAAEDAYAAAFDDYGIGEEEKDVEAAVAAIASTGVAEELSAYLDEWLWIRATVDAPVDDLLEVANRVDPDPWRTRLRLAAAARDESELLALAAKPELTGSSPRLLARHLAAAGRHEAAVGLLRRAQRERPTDVWLAFDLGFELTMLVPPRWEEAVGFFRVARASRPRNREVAHQLGIAFLKLRRPEEALSLIEDALRAHPDFTHLYDHLIEAREQRGDLDRLVDEWRIAAEDAPEDPLAWYRYGRACEAATRKEEMLAAYAAAHRLDPESRLYRERLALAHLYAGDADAAARLTKGDRERTDLPFVHGLVLWLEDDNRAMLDMLEDAIGRNPWRPLLLDMQLQILAEERRFEEAEAANRRAMAVYPDRLTGRIGRAWIRFQKGDLDGAIALLREAVALPERLAEGRFRATVETDIDLSTGRESQRVVLRPWNQKASAWNLLGRVQRGRGHWEDARRSFRQSWLLTPDAFSSCGNLADLLYVFGEQDEACVLYESILSRRVDEYATYYLAFGRLAQGRFDEAERLFGEFARAPLLAESPESRRAQWAHDLPIAFAVARDLPATLAGKRAWSGPRERAVAAWALQEMGFLEASAELFGEAFAEEPALAGEPAAWPKLCHNATYAVMGALGASRGLGVGGAEIDEATRADWRRRALDWMRLDLECWRRRNDPVEEARQLREYLNYQLFANCRHEQCLAELLPEEADGWRLVWKEVEARLARHEAEGR